MNQDIKISVIIPVYNTAQYIEQCIESILNQSYENIELILVDDGSNQKTKNKIKELSDKVNIILTQENQGQSTARNNGIKKATGDVLLVLDSDDYFEPNFCKKAIEFLKNTKNTKIITCNCNIINEEGKIIGGFNPVGGDISKMILNNTAMGSCMFKKREWSLAGGYDENMRSGFEDWEFYIRLLSTGGNVYVIPELLFNYRKCIQSTTTKANEVKYDLLKYIYKKNEDIYKKYFNNFILFLLSRIEREEKEKLKMYSKIEYKIGFNILKPLRFVKRIFNGK